MASGKCVKKCLAQIHLAGLPSVNVQVFLPLLKQQLYIDLSFWQAPSAARSHANMNDHEGINQVWLIVSVHSFSCLDDPTLSVVL